MAELKLKSERQIQLDMLATIIAELGLNDVNPGSVLDIITQAAAQEDFAQYVQMAQIARLVNLDAITGDDLDNKAFEFGLERQQAIKAKGKVDILRAASFVKVSTTFYSGSPAPIVNDSIIDVNDASNVLIGSSGTLILGRDTANEEEVTYSVAPVDNTNFWRFTLDAPLTKNHTIEETVILKQGNDELILAGTTVRVPSTGTNSEIIFTIDEDVTLKAGEDRLANVEVTAVEAGTGGNIPVKAISDTAAFPTAPFPGARAENTSKFTTGKNRQSDDDLRDAIKNHIQSLSRGVKEAILNAIVGLVDAETAKRVVSANIVLPQDECGVVKVYIDDGTGFEPGFESEGFEEVLRNSTGGETRLQLDVAPLVKAQIESNSAEPFDMSGGSKTLTYNVGNLSETILFSASDFEFSDTATAEEIVTAINDKASLIEARTSQTGTQIVIQAKAEVNEHLQITGGTANPILNFPTDEKFTLFLYIDDILKSKDGETATLDSGNQAPFDLANIGAFPHVLNVIVDGKTANPQVVTFQSADFVDPAAATVAEILAVINAQLTGVTAIAADNNTRVRLISNTKISVNSKLEITGGSANDATDGLNFSTIEIVGEDGDYTLNRELGTIELAQPLTANQSVTVGTQFSRAKLRAGFSELYSPANGETLIISVDGGSDQTITFDISFAGGKTAQATADFINLQLKGATAIVREVGIQKFVEINTNTYDTANGSIEIKSTSTANGSFGFPEDQVEINQRPHKAFRVSGNSGPFVFTEAQGLVVIMDNDIVNGTFSTIMDFDGDVTAGVSTTQFNDSVFANVFGVSDELVDYYCAFTSGANTVTGTVATVIDAEGLDGVNEVQQLSFDLDPDSGTFTITFSGDTTAALNWNDSAATIEAALEALPSIGVGNISVAGVVDSTTGLTLTFQGTLEKTDVAEVTSISSLLQGATPVVITPSTTTPGDPGQVANTFRYEFDSLPTNLANIQVGDLIKLTDLDAAGNNGFFQITAVSTAGNGHIEILNPGGIGATLQTGTALMSERRQITAYNNVSGLITVGSAFSNIPSIGDAFIVIPSTIDNLVRYFNNTKVTPLSLKATITGVEQNTKLQIESKLDGSDGYVQVSGGSANDELAFNTDTQRGLQAYNYYVGLLALVHKTIYGDDTDLVSFPGVGAAGVQFQVLAPTVREVSINVNVTLSEGTSVASLENEIKSAISSYINNLGVGDDVVIEEIRAAVIKVKGVIDVVLNAPTANIAAADNEIARTRDSLIIIG